MKPILIAAVMALIVSAGAAFAEEAVPETFELKDGSTLYVHPDGTHRMVDVHGKPMQMADGQEMELMDGRMVMMKNKKVWVTYGPPSRQRKVIKSE